MVLKKLARERAGFQRKRSPLKKKGEKVRRPMNPQVKKKVSCVLAVQKAIGIGGPEDRCKD